MELVYLLGNGSKWQDNELRHSLRSVAMYGKNVTGITLLGNRPHWVAGATHIPLPDPHPLKANNTWYKLRRFCDGRTAPFVLMNDDFFLTKETDFENFTNYTYGTIEDLALSYRRKGAYITALLATERVLMNNNLPVKNYALHVPMLVNTVKVRGMFEKFGEQPGVSFRNMAGNIMNNPTTEMADVKLSDWIGQQQTDAYLADKWCFSIGDRFLTDEGKQYIKSLFPDSCKYEK